MNLAAMLARLLADEDGSLLAEGAMLFCLLAAIGVGFFAFAADQFRDVFQGSYQFK